MTKAIISDLDGTLLPSRHTIISDENIRAFQEAGTAGLTRIIATGRTLFASMKVLPDDFPIDYLVFSSGAGILRWHDKKIIFSRHLTLEETKEVADYLWNYNINFTIQREIPDNHHFYYTNIYPVHADYLHRIETYRDFGSPISCSSDINSRSTQLILILDALQLRLVEQIRNDLPDYSVIRTTSPVDHQAIWLEIFPKDTNKGTICSHLLGLLEISCSECAGLGNDYNDVDFLEICHSAFIVSNAPPRLKSLFKSVSSDIDNGFAEFIATILNRKNGR